MRDSIENDRGEYWRYGEDMAETIPAEEFFRHLSIDESINTFSMKKSR